MFSFPLQDKGRKIKTGFEQFESKASQTEITMEEKEKQIHASGIAGHIIMGGVGLVLQSHFLFPFSESFLPQSNGAGIGAPRGNK